MAKPDFGSAQECFKGGERRIGRGDQEEGRKEGRKVRKGRERSKREAGMDYAMAQIPLRDSSSSFWDVKRGRPRLKC